MRCARSALAGCALLFAAPDPRPSRVEDAGKRADGGARRRGTRHRQRGRAHLAHAPAPTVAEHRPSAETLQECETLVADGVDGLPCVAPTRGSDRLGHSSIVRKTEHAAQHLAGARNAGIHAVIERGVVDAGGKLVTAQRVPVPVAIDGGDLRLRRLPHVLRQAGMRAAPAHPLRLDNPARSPPAGIARIVVVATLVHEQARERLAPGRCRHGRPRLSVVRVGKAGRVGRVRRP